MRDDQLNRGGFARSAAAELMKVGGEVGLVLSVEGAWGSGKTSALAMIEEVLAEQDKPPIAIRFNPWLVGDRDSLLRQFLAKLAETVRLSDRTKAGKKAAKELKTYAKVFDVLKLVPGAEPWASMIKSVVESVGDATDSIAEYKAPDIEVHKGRVEDALKEFATPIIVFIDDIDRLFPLEVFEMIRIVKAVGDLPNVGYVLAWDPTYVARALKRADVPQAKNYLDKIIQIRLALPPLSSSARLRLINRALETLDGAAKDVHFSDSDDRLSILYHAGLKDLLNQPRDFIRVFNVVRTIEPALRGEVALADLIGLATLMVKAPSVYQLMRQQPRYFVGLLPGDTGLLKKEEDWLREGESRRKRAYDLCAEPSDVENLVGRLFPATAVRGSLSGIVSGIDGHLGSPTRLVVALQMGITGSDVSMVAARRFLIHPEQRLPTAMGLTGENCLEFLEALHGLGKALVPDGISDLEQLCVAVARLVDMPSFAERSNDRSGFFTPKLEHAAGVAIHQIVSSVSKGRMPSIAEAIVEDSQSLSVANYILQSGGDEEEPDDPSILRCSRSAESRVLERFSGNVADAARRGSLLAISNPWSVLWNLARLVPGQCPQVFEAIQATVSDLDRFADAIFYGGHDSNKGTRMQMPRDKGILEAYVSIERLRHVAASRLADSSLTYPTRAAWRVVLEDNVIYARDGSIAQRH